MPIFDDAEGNTPFDYVLQIHNKTQEEIDSKVRLGSFNKNLALVLFEQYQNHEFMSLGRSITRAIPEAIDKEVQAVAKFMDSRMFESKHLWTTQYL